MGGRKLNRRNFLRSAFIFTAGLWVPKMGILRSAEAGQISMVGGGAEAAVAPSIAWEELWEDTGYAGGWGEDQEAGDDVDPDALSSAVGSPSGWGTQCLKVARLGNNATWAYCNLGTARAITYTRVEIVPTVEGLANNEVTQIFTLFDSSIGAFFKLYLKQDGSGNLKFTTNVGHDGVGEVFDGFPTLSLSTKYRIEIKWDATSDKWAWKIDGTAQPNDQDATDPVTAEGLLTGTHKTNQQWLACGGAAGSGPAFTAYYDKLAVATNTWVGA